MRLTPPTQACWRLAPACPTECASSSASMTRQPTPSSPRMGLPRPTTMVSAGSARRTAYASPAGGALITAHLLQREAVVVPDGDDQGHLPRHRMRGAAEAGIVGAEAHLDA